MLKPTAARPKFREGMGDLREDLKPLKCAFRSRVGIPTSYARAGLLITGHKPEPA